MLRGKRLRSLTMLVVGYYLTFQVGFALAATARWEGNPTERIDLEEKGVFNAAKTGYSDVDGFNGYLRNFNGQKVHSDFFLNTNSCASCHMTHSGQGEKLLFQASVYNTCSTCHFDASLNTYNILAGEGMPGGLFFDGDVVPVERDGVSFHLATGAKMIKDAPGADATAYDQPFTCGSCHAPHGSYGERHLQLNPNGKAERYHSVRLLADGESEGRLRPDLPQNTAPWLYYDADSAYFAAHGLVIRHDSGEIATEKFFVHYREGYVEVLAEYRDEILAEAQNGAYRITFSRAMLVDIEVVPAGNGEESVYRSGTSDFCAACHSGYLGQNGDGRTIVIHQSFSHQINEDLSGYLEREEITADSRLKLERDRNGSGARLVCLTCHFAHGTDAGLMTDRNFTLLYDDGSGQIPEKTSLLRFGKVDGEWEACFTCHDSGGPATEIEAAGEEQVEAPVEETGSEAGQVNAGAEGEAESGSGEPEQAPLGEEPAAPADPAADNPSKRENDSAADNPDDNPSFEP